MPIEVLMPALSPTMTQGHLVKWHKNIGDAIKSGDLLMDVETDKATMEVEATQAGFLDRIVIQAPTENVPIGRVIALLRLANEPEGISATWTESLHEMSQNSDAQSVVPPSQPHAVTNAHGNTIQESQCAQPVIVPFPQTNPQEKITLCTLDQSINHPTPQNRILVSPLAKKLAHHHSLSLREIKGSGPGGRIVKRDIEGALSHKQHVQEKAYSPLLQEALVEKIALTAMRKTIAERLTFSKQTIPHFYLSVTCRVDQLLGLRAQMNARHKIFSVNDFILRACALALKNHPAMCTLWQGDHLTRHSQIDLAIAVSIPGGLITPILRNASAQSLGQISAMVKDMAERARSGRLMPQDYQGGVFTVSNLGMYGIDAFHPIINPPHSGILAVGAAKKQPVVQGDQIEIGHVMTLTLAADHRAVDGEDAAKFLRELQDLLENPFDLLA